MNASMKNSLPSSFFINNSELSTSTLWLENALTNIIAAENDTAAKEKEILDLREKVEVLQAEQTTWRDESSTLRKTIDSLKGKVNELSRSLEALREKYEKVMQFIEKFDLKEKLDKFLHPIKNINKHR